MSKFKDGDRVRVTNMSGDYTPNFWVGTEGVIAGEGFPRGNYRVDRDDAKWSYFNEYELESVTTEVLEEELEKAKKLLQETQASITQLEQKLSENRTNKYANAELGTIVKISELRFVKISQNSWVLISEGGRKFDSAQVYRDAELAAMEGKTT